MQGEAYPFVWNFVSGARMWLEHMDDSARSRSGVKPKKVSKPFQRVCIISHSAGQFWPCWVKRNFCLFFLVIPFLYCSDFVFLSRLLAAWQWRLRKTEAPWRVRGVFFLRHTRTPRLWTPSTSKCPGARYFGQRDTTPALCHSDSAWGKYFHLCFFTCRVRTDLRRCLVLRWISCPSALGAS